MSDNLKEGILALAVTKMKRVAVTGSCKLRRGQTVRSKIQLQESAQESLDRLPIPVCRPRTLKKHFDTLQVRSDKVATVTLQLVCLR
jgi:hypothetical protein